MNASERPLIMHVMHRFDVGGLENGVVNLVDNLPEYRHAIVALTEITQFRERIRAADVAFVAMHKPPGHGVWIYPQLYRLFRQMKPAVVHTRNLAALEMTVAAFAAGVPVRVHGEHGRDVGDLDGSSPRHWWIRRAYRPFVHHYVALSADLERYLVRRVGVRPARIAQIYNGVDTVRFAPASVREPIAGCPFDDPRLLVFGGVGRMVAVKDPVTLVRAYVELRARADHVRLMMIGDGPLRATALDVARNAGLERDVWMPGERGDVPALLRGMDCFVLPSLGEGISNTILEAMATGLPVIATDVGGNAELVRQGVTGRLVRAGDSHALAQAMLDVVHDRATFERAGAAGRSRALSQFSLDGMIRRYRNLYDTLLRASAARTSGLRSPQHSSGK
jgi:sugar transferase (PEP-CTERM/EpsH1 system associated)